eukprot:gene514-649_t
MNRVPTTTIKSVYSLFGSSSSSTNGNVVIVNNYAKRLVSKRVYKSLKTEALNLSKIQSPEAFSMHCYRLL